MKTILDQPRDITIDGRTERFRDYAYLGERIEIVVEDIQRAEARIDADSDDAAAEWAYIARSADLLESLLVVQEQWLAEHDAVVGQDAEILRAEIRKLTSSSYKGGEEDGT